MRQPKYLALLAAFIFSTFCMILNASAQKPEELREEFHQTYPLSASGRLSLENINGAVKIAAWDRNEVKVDAVKRAYSQERLAQAKIIVTADADRVQVKTDYPETTFVTDEGQGRRHENPASVDYVIMIPRTARLDSIEIINGPLDLEGIRGEIKASLINGPLTARGLVSSVKLSTINGKVDATFVSLNDVRQASINSVNGPVLVVVPSDANAEVKVDTVHGEIASDFGFNVRKGRYVGRNMFGRLGQGGASLKISNVNGAVQLKHANDGRPVSPVSDFSRADDDTAEFDMNEKTHREIERAAAQAASQATRARESMRRDRERAIREAQRAQAQVQRVQRDVRRLAEEDAQVARAFGGGESYYRLAERDNRSFNVSGQPNVILETFDGSVKVRSWDKNEVAYNVTKRAVNEESLRKVIVTGEQSGSNISITAGVNKADATGGVRATASFEVMVPRSANITVRSGDGGINLDRVEGNLQIKSGDGAIYVSESKGTLNIHTGDGAVRIDGFDGRATVRSDDGRLVLRGRFSDLAASTNDGAIILETPQDQNVTIETNAETVHNDGLAVEETPSDKQIRRWRVGGGGKLFKLQTGDGAIFLRKLSRSTVLGSN